MLYAQIPPRLLHQPTFDPDWFNVNCPERDRIRAEWQARYDASENMTTVDGFECNDCRITNADDLAFMQHVFGLIRYNRGLGYGDDADETKALAMGGWFPPPPPSRYKDDWLGGVYANEGDGLFLCYSGGSIENHYGWCVYCGPCQCLIEADEPHCC